MKIPRTIRKLFADMTEDERKIYLEATEGAVKRWGDTLFKVFGDTIVFAAMNGKSFNSRDVKRGMKNLNIAYNFLSYNAELLSQWKQMMKTK